MGAPDYVGGMKPVIRLEAPTAKEGFALFESAGWNEGYRISREDYARALGQSWAVATARLDGRLVGIGRVISDGALYALLVDLIVHPEVQDKGIGRALVDRLIDRCRASRLRSLQLFAAEGSEGFYRGLGFRARPDGRPGMEIAFPAPA